MPEIQIITDQGDACGEGPLWDADSSCFYWVDITGEKLHTCYWPSKQVTSTHPGFPLSALALAESKNLLVAGTGGLWIWDRQGEKRQLFHDYHGQALALNDCIADERGRLLAGSTFFDGTPAYPLGSLYCFDTDGSITVLDEGFGLANGMGFSPDSTTLYFTDSAARRIYAYDYNADTGSVKHRRLFVQASNDEGLPDGLTVDSEGYVWSAQWFGGCIIRYDPDGVIERRIRIPAHQTSSVAFGGPDLTDIFVTSAAVPDALALAPIHYQAAKNVGGPLFHLNVGIPGKPEFRCQVPTLD